VTPRKLPERVERVIGVYAPSQTFAFDAATLRALLEAVAVAAAEEERDACAFIAGAIANAGREAFEVREAIRARSAP
jgi:hypothetical protein